MDFNKTLAKLLGNDKKFNEVQIDQRVIDEIIDIARQADPEEYVALLSGKVEKKILKIKGLIFLPFQASSTSAVMQVFMLPLSTDAVGSVHSHPGPSNMPSDADLQFFGKNGYFHMIIAHPFRIRNAFCGNRRFSCRGTRFSRRKIRFFAGRLDLLPMRVYNNTEPVYRDYYLIV